MQFTSKTYNRRIIDTVNLVTIVLIFLNIDFMITIKHIIIYKK